MDGQRRIRQFDVWVVTDGAYDRYLSLDEHQAGAFAETLNRFAAQDQQPVHVERKRATVIGEAPAASSTSPPPP